MFQKQISRAACEELELPGTLGEKIDPYLRPLYDALHDMIDPETIPKLLASGVIEVAPVAADRWRAYIVRVPGVPTALMPFYGTTPGEAARQLSDWLTRAHARAASST